jgi:cysteinyl-tRNA synthetase
VHLGGIHLIFPHHENEIAQSEAKTGKRFVNYWVHGAHMLVDGKKMSKSLGNFYRLQDIVDKGFEPLALRYLYLQTHYRQEMNFTWDALEASQNALNKLRRHYADAKDGDMSLPKEFEEAISEDLNFPKALSVIWENISSLSKNAFDKADEILGLNLAAVKKEESNIPQEISVLAEKREELRKAGNFEEADRVREEIKEKGFLVEDSPGGIRIRKTNL